MSALWLLAAIALLAVAYVILTYNRLVSLRRRVEEAWSDIQVQMKRRYDLIPTLIDSVKGAMAHERGLLEAVTRARAVAVADHGSPQHQAHSEAALQHALRGLFAVAESYPQLRVNENFLALQRDLTDTENLIHSARRFYNGSVRALNVAIEQFPSNLVARRFGFTAAEFFELEPADAAAAAPVRVTFS